MRDIRFRVWDKPAKMFVYFIVKLGEEVFLDPTIYDENLYLFIGLKDNIKWEQLTEVQQQEWIARGETKETWNGVEIYESDLITHHSRNEEKPHLVIFDLKQAAWCGDYGLKYPLIEGELEEIAVVGNKYENPELWGMKKMKHPISNHVFKIKEEL